MKCPKCKKSIDYVDVAITPANQTDYGTVKIDDNGKPIKAPEMDGPDGSGVDVDPNVTFTCSKYDKDLNAYIDLNVFGWIFGRCGNA